MQNNPFLYAEENASARQSADGTGGQDVRLASVYSVDTENASVRLLLDGTDTPTQKSYKALSSAWPLAEDDRVIVLKMSGTYVVVGKIGAADAPDPGPDPDPPTGILPIENGGTGDSGLVYESTVANIITAGTNVTINSAYYVKWGKVAQVQVYFSLSSASTFVILGNVVEGKRPKVTSFGGTTAGGTATLYFGGDIYINGSFSANTRYAMGVTYLLP